MGRLPLNVEGYKRDAIPRMSNGCFWSGSVAPASAFAFIGSSGIVGQYSPSIGCQVVCVR